MHSLGLHPITSLVCSPQGNGMAESFVNMFKRERQLDIARWS